MDDFLGPEEMNYILIGTSHLWGWWVEIALYLGLYCIDFLVILSYCLFLTMGLIGKPKNCMTLVWTHAVMCGCHGHWSDAQVLG